MKLAQYGPLEHVLGDGRLEGEEGANHSVQDRAERPHVDLGARVGDSLDDLGRHGVRAAAPLLEARRGRIVGGEAEVAQLDRERRFIYEDVLLQTYSPIRT